MSVLATAYSVIVHRSRLEELYPGGSSAFEVRAGNGYCCDGKLCRAMFLSRGAAWQFAERLAMQTGMTLIDGDRFVDIAVIDGSSGPMHRCDWLMFRFDKGFMPVVGLPHEVEEVVARPVTGGSSSGQLFGPATSALNEGIGAVISREPVQEESADELFADLLNALAGLMVSHFNKREQARADDRPDEVAEYDLRLRGVVEDLREIIARHGEMSTHGLYVLGLANCFAGYWQEGERLLKDCTVLSPKFSAGWEALAFCEQMMGHFEESVIAAGKLRSLEPASALACHYKAESLAALGRYDEALSVAMDAVALDPSDIHRFTLERIADTRNDAMCGQSAAF